MVVCLCRRQLPTEKGAGVELLAPCVPLRHDRADPDVGRVHLHDVLAAGVWMGKNGGSNEQVLEFIKLRLCLLGPLKGSQSGGKAGEWEDPERAVPDDWRTPRKLQPSKDAARFLVAVLLDRSIVAGKEADSDLGRNEVEAGWHSQADLAAETNRGIDAHDDHESEPLLSVTQSLWVIIFVIVTPSGWAYLDPEPQSVSLWNTLIIFFKWQFSPHLKRNLNGLSVQDQEHHLCGGNNDHRDPSPFSSLRPWLKPCIYPAPASICRWLVLSGPRVRHPVVLVCLSVPQSVSLTWLHSSCASTTTSNWRDRSALISIRNEFPPVSQDLSHGSDGARR